MQLLNGQPAPSVFAIRVISKRFGQKFTGKSLSPTIGPAGTGIQAPGSTPASAYEQCLAAAQANPAGDEDKDSLSNGLEKTVGDGPVPPRHRHRRPQRRLGVPVGARPELARLPVPRQEAVAEPA